MRELTDKERRVTQAYRRVFNSVEGQVILEDMKAAHHYESSTLAIAGSPIDPVMMAAAEGERNVVLRILTLMNTKE